MFLFFGSFNVLVHIEPLLWPSQPKEPIKSKKILRVQGKVVFYYINQ
jgi:hypothetical protein